MRRDLRTGRSSPATVGASISFRTRAASSVSPSRSDAAQARSRACPPNRRMVARADRFAQGSGAARLRTWVWSYGLAGSRFPSGDLGDGEDVLQHFTLSRRTAASGFDVEGERRAAHQRGPRRRSLARLHLPEGGRARRRPHRPRLGSSPVNKFRRSLVSSAGDEALALARAGLRRVPGPLGPRGARLRGATRSRLVRDLRDALVRKGLATKTTPRLTRPQLASVHESRTRCSVPLLRAACPLRELPLTCS